MTVASTLLMPIDSDGRYNPEDGNLRLDVVKGNQSSSRFTGDVQGREVARWWQIGKTFKAAAKACQSKLPSGGGFEISDGGNK